MQRFALMICLALAAAPALASDHSDSPTGPLGARIDANLSDLHVFSKGQNLVLSTCTNTAIPPTATSYVFPSDVTFEFHLDVTSAVSAEDPDGYGGTILDPSHIKDDVVYRIRFRQNGSADLKRLNRGGGSQGSPDRELLRRPARRSVHSRAARGTQLGVHRHRDAALGRVAQAEHDPRVGDEQGGRVRRTVPGPRGRAAARDVPRAGAAQQHPAVAASAEVRRHAAPIVFDTSEAASFPNGRALTDDVVDLMCSLAGECRVFNSENPSPTANDVPFLNDFPYLAPPQPPL
jgi:hypothetical protein